VFLVAPVLLASCTGGNDAGGGEPDARGTPSTGSTPVAEGSPLAAPGAEAIELTGPPIEDAGEVPTFAWTAVSGAASYRLVVLDPEGGPIWSWQGTETSVNLGGLPSERPVGEAGPVIEAGSSWTVAALDVAGHVMAVSVARPISP